MSWGALVCSFAAIVNNAFVSFRRAFLRILVNSTEALEQMENAVRNDGVGGSNPSCGYGCASAALFNEPVGTGALVQLSSILGLIAECVFNKDAAELCDANNRALAVDAIGSHVRHADSVLAQPNVSASLQLSQLAALKERVIVGVRGHLRDGSLIAADFGMFAPDEVRRIARETKPIRNACATAGKSR